jgi:hypothetical protein
MGYEVPFQRYPEVVKQALESGTGDSLFTAPLEVVVIDKADKCRLTTNW